MKKALMTQFPCARGRAFVCKNIGDYVQSVAARQYCQPYDTIIEQEEADQFFPEDKCPVRLIMNGWFQWRAENWPPSEFVYPLFISMHISPLREQQLLQPKGVDYLKKFSPIGCRDHYTKNLLEGKGINAYFSGCLTLTLGKDYHINTEKEREGIYFVDPYFDIPELIYQANGKKKINWPVLIKVFFYSVLNWRTVFLLGKKSFFKDYSPQGFLDRDHRWYRPFYKAAVFLKTYSQKFSRKLLKSANYITHWMDVDMSGAVTTNDLLDTAEKLVKKYASAKLIITSRIHAGLPGLGLDTPVIFIANEEVVSENGNFNTPGRLGGLLELFRILNLTHGKFSTDDEVLSKYPKITEKTQFPNKQTWKPYADQLDKKCTEFMKDDFAPEK
ncbi:MAG: polysaccharide pyruvyl transferase family protein [Thermoguttaceae bacterium]|nr:polysaccharide pyruvyl transferase family protein [Thermoguttaceae bacterium]